MSQRKDRGIRCSRAKLDAALAASHIEKKTQFALAEAIADSESLESVPKDLVSKMFRELAVDSQSIERVAKVLGVPAQSLYLTDENPGEDTEIIRPQQYRSVIILISLLVVIGSAFLYLQNHEDKDSCYNRMSLGSPDSSNNSITVVIARLSGDPGNQAQLMLATKLADDQRLQEGTEIFSSCMKMSFNGDQSIRDQIISGHNQARQELKIYNAQLVVWGERYGDRINLRFTSNGPVNQIKKLVLADKTIHTNETDFSFNARLDDESAFSGDLQLVILSMLSPESPRFTQLKNQLIEQYNYSGSWLKEAVISDTNLLQRISKESDPKLYQLTLSQLCFRGRLLGDLESSESNYLQAEEACNKALEVFDKDTSPMQWASLKGNLAALTTRKQLYAQSKEERLKLLQTAISIYSEIEPTYNKLAHPSEAATFYQNYAVAYIRMSEVQPENAISLLENAQDKSSKSIALSNEDANPLYHAQRLQNQCMLKYRLGAMQQDAVLLTSAITDCESAKTFISNKEHPAESAMILNNLAVSYAILAELRSDPEAFQQALASFDTAQLIYTKELYPVNWGEVEINKAELMCKLALVAENKSFMANAKISADAALLVFVQQDIKPYQTYAENLLTKIRQCNDLPINDCQCSS